MQKKTTIVFFALAIAALLTGCGRESAVRKSVTAIIKALDTNDARTLSELAPFLAADTSGQSSALYKHLKKILSEDYLVRFESDDKAILVFRGDPAVLLGMTRTSGKAWVLQGSVLFNQTIDIIEKSSE